MSSTFVFNKRWQDETIESLTREIRIARNLIDDLKCAKRNSLPERVQYIERIIRDTENLERSLIKTRNALRTYEELVEANAIKATSAYANAKKKADNVFD